MAGAWALRYQDGRGPRRSVGNPRALIRAPAAALRPIASDAGSTVAAWLRGPAGANAENPVGSVQVATRTTSTRFGAPATLGADSTLSLAGSSDGHAVLVADRHIDGTSVVVSVSRRDLTGPSDPLRTSRPRSSSAMPTPPPAPAGVFAAVAEPAAAFGSPQQLADAQTATLPQPTAGAITSSEAIVAWTGRDASRAAPTED